MKIMGNLLADLSLNLTDNYSMDINHDNISHRQLNTYHHYFSDYQQQQQPTPSPPSPPPPLQAHSTNMTNHLNSTVENIFPRRYAHTPRTFFPSSSSSSSSSSSVSSAWSLNDLNFTSMPNSQRHSPTVVLDANDSDMISVVTSNNNNNSNNNDNDDSLSNDIQPGGYPEELFIDLLNSEKEDYLCTICFLILKDPYQCQNQHKFCYGCIYTWSTGPTAGHDTCPVCRCDGLYAKNFDLNEQMNAKHVQCLTDGCNWMGLLSAYQHHEHRHYTPDELDLSLSDYIKYQMNSYLLFSSSSPSSSSAGAAASLPTTAHNPMIYNKGMVKTANGMPLRRYGLQEISNNHLLDNNNNDQINLNIGQVPVVCEPINNLSTNQSLFDHSMQRLLTMTTTPNRITPMSSIRNRQAQNRNHNRSIFNSDDNMNQLENIHDSIEALRRSYYLPATTTHQSRILRLRDEQPQYQQSFANVSTHSRQTRSYVPSLTQSSTTMNNNSDGHRQGITTVRDSRTHIGRLPNVVGRRQTRRGEQAAHSLIHVSSGEVDNQFSLIHDAISLLAVNSNSIHNPCSIEGNNDLRDHHINNDHQQHSDHCQTIHLPAMLCDDEAPITSNLDSRQINNNNNNTQTLSVSSNNSNSRQRQTNRPFEFRRLVPPQRHRRVVEQLRETREQLATLLRRMTIELEERQNHALMYNNSDSSSSSSSSGTTSRLSRNSNNLFNDQSISYAHNNTVNHEFTTYNSNNNHHTSGIPRNIHTRSTCDNDNDLTQMNNNYTSQSIDIISNTLTNTTNPRDLSRLLITPIYREHNNNNNMTTNCSTVSSLKQNTTTTATARTNNEIDYYYYNTSSTHIT
ncbi:unnamed protein product [Schistosoma turkestanicum]|nr:unnamed protein product [Schistosoma turkestanicum]